MRRLVYYVAATVDGFIADANHQVDMFGHHGDHVDDYLTALKRYDTIVMGRKTWEFGQRLGVTDPYPWAYTVVFGRFEGRPDPRVIFSADDPARVVGALKEQDGTPIYLAGGGELARSLFEAQLIDELLVKVNPLLLGAGVPLAPRLRNVQKLTLRSCNLHSSGVLVPRYDVEYGAAQRTS